MLFNIPSLIHFYSESFIPFFLIVFILFWLSPSKLKPMIILISSYVFYASWDYRFLFLIILSTVIDYLCGKKILTSKNKKKFLYTSIIINIGILFIFKSYNFFVDEFIVLLSFLGLQKTTIPLNILLPLGISFYTFQTLTYTIDIYRGRLKPEKSFVTFAAFVAFFPQLIAGPIERASQLIPQIKTPKKFKDIEFEKGFYLFVYGFFKKRVIADSMAIYVEQGYGANSPTGVESLLALIAFTIQVYCDISGYTYMARGLACFLGIDLSRNFSFPLFSKSPSDFWSKWHMTLSFWVRDYVYMPLLIRLKNPYIATLIAFIIMGAWLGFKGTHFFWGIYWGSMICLYQFMKVKKIDLSFNSNALKMLLMLPIIIIGQTIFRADSIHQYFRLWMSALTNFTWGDFHLQHYFNFIFLTLALFLYEFILVFKRNSEFYLLNKHFVIKIIFYLFLFFTYRNIGEVPEIEFIYFNH